MMDGTFSEITVDFAVIYTIVIHKEDFPRKRNIKSNKLQNGMGIV